MELRFYHDPETDLPHMYNHDVTEQEVEHVLRQGFGGFSSPHAPETTMTKKIKTSKKNKFPKGWNEARVRKLIKHYESQSDEAAAAEDDALFSDSKHTYMRIPVQLIPAVRKLLNKRAG